MFRRNRPLAVAAEEENPFHLSFADIMSGLLILFILSSLALIWELKNTQKSVTQAIQSIAAAEQIRSELISEITVELAEQGIAVEVSDNHSVMRIPDTTLTFPPNEYTLPDTPEMQKAVAEIARVLYRAITKGERYRYIDTVFIEGFTDIRPTSRQGGNERLSSDRAITVWTAWNQALPAGKTLRDLRNAQGKPLFSFSGYGSTRPVQAIQRTEEDFQKNRRIDVRFTVRRPALEEYETVRNLIGERL